MCQSSSGSIRIVSGSQMSQTLDNEDELQFQMVKPRGVDFIPPNYFCKWTIDIEVES